MKMNWRRHLIPALQNSIKKEIKHSKSLPIPLKLLKWYKANIISFDELIEISQEALKGEIK